MRNKLIYVSCMLMILVLAGTSRADLMAYYSMDEGQGNVVTDGTGNGHDGQITSTPTWAQSNTGNGTAVQFGAGGGSGVMNCGNWDTTGGTGTFTVSMWINFNPTSTYTQYQGIIGNRNSNTDQYWGLEMSHTSGATTGSCYFGAAGMTGGATSYGITTLTAGTWTHLAISFDGTRITVYRDGAQTATNTSPRYATNPNKTAMVRIGGSEETSNFFQGMIDEVYIFNSILTLDEVKSVMNGDLKPAVVVTGKAKFPYPAGKGVSIDVNKAYWTSGEFAVKHNVFMGTNFDDVNTATLANPNGTTVYEGLDVNTISLAKLPYETTYYWRVDEVNAPSKPATYTGHVWSFTTESAGTAIAKTSIINVTTAGEYAYPGEQEPNYTCNGKGLDANDMHSDKYPDMWLVSADGPGMAWIQYEFDKVYMIYDMIVWNYNEESPGQEFGVQDANVTYSMDGVTWTALPLQKFNEATGENAYKANTTVDMNHAIAKFVRITFLTSFEGSDVYGLSEVRFRAEPTRAQSPSPANAATGQAITSALKWTPGRYNVQHYVYISTDANDVNNVPGHSVAPIIVSDANVIPGLDLGKKYYWRVDEVNMANTYTTWTGPTWNLSTVASLTLDNFEAASGYGNNPDTNAVFLTWIDGLGIATNGSQIGNNDSPYLSSTRHAGTWGAPMKYDNTGTSKAATDSFVTAQSVKLQQKTNDWSKGHPTALVIWFRGDPNNIPDQMYVKLNSTKILYAGDLGDLTQSLWRPFVVDLASINLGNITSITIGLEKIETGGKGIVYLDDIALYGVAPATAAQPVNPGNTDLIAYYSMENSIQDISGNGHNGTYSGTGTPTYVEGMAGRGMVMQFNGTSDAVNLGQNAAFNFEGSFTISVWARISAWSSGWGYTMVGNRGESDKGGWQIRRYSGNPFCFTTRGISNDDMTSNANPPPLNEWVNFTCVYDSATFTKKIYIDGMLDKTVNLTGTTKKVTATTGIDTYIGARAKTDNTGPENFFNGRLDEVRIYNRALSAGEAAYLGKVTP